MKCRLEKLIIAILFLLNFTLQDVRENKVPFTVCPNGCTNCFQNKSTGKANCVSCYKRMGQPGNKCEYFNGMSKTRCLIWSLDRCVLCEKGLYPTSVLDKLTGNKVCNLCQEGNSPEMTVAFLNIETQDVQIRVCEDGIPNEEMTQCLSFGNLGSEIQNLPSLQNCVWGARDSKGVIGCYKCEENFISKFGKEYSESGHCVLRSELETEKVKFRGCLRVQDSEGYDVGRCVLCDYSKGFYMHNYHGECRLML